MARLRTKKTESEKPADRSRGAGVRHVSVKCERCENYWHIESRLGGMFNGQLVRIRTRCSEITVMEG